MTNLKADLLERKSTIVAYCAEKLKAGDWHAVQDAASDIREIDAKLELLTVFKLDQLTVFSEQQVETDPAVLRRIG